jgi:hypothetical protein
VFPSKRLAIKTIYELVREAKRVVATVERGADLQEAKIE